MNQSPILNQILDAFARETARWYGEILPLALNVFLLLATIQLSWSAMWWILERSDSNSFVAAILRRVLYLAFGYGLLLNFRAWSFALLDGFAAAGRQASGLPVLDPSTVMDQGIAVASILLRETFDAGLVGFVTGGVLLALAGLIVFFAFVVVAMQMLLTTIEAFFVLGAGVLFVSFAGLQLTAPIAGRLISFAFGIGAKLFTVYLVVGVGMHLVQDWVPLLEASGQSLPALLEVLGASVVYAFVAWSIPNLTASMMNGAITLTMSDAVFAASSSARAGRAAVGGAGVAMAPVGNVLARVRNAAAPAAASASSQVSSTLRRVVSAAGPNTGARAAATRKPPRTPKSPPSKSEASAE